MFESAHCISSARPNPPNPHLIRGFDLANNHDYRLAGIEFDRAIKADPTNPDAYYNRAFVKAAREDYAGAIRDYSRALKIDDADEEAYVGRAEAKAQLENHSGAIEDSTRAIELNPWNARAYRVRASSRSQMGDFYGAVADHLNASIADPAPLLNGLKSASLSSFRGFKAMLFRIRESETAANGVSRVTRFYSSFSKSCFDWITTLAPPVVLVTAALAGCATVVVGVNHFFQSSAAEPPTLEEAVKHYKMFETSMNESGKGIDGAKYPFGIKIPTLEEAQKDYDDSMKKAMEDVSRYAEAAQKNYDDIMRKAVEDVRGRYGGYQDSSGSGFDAILNFNR